MKKIISVMMAFVMSTSMGLFFACEKKPCKHAFGEWETVTEPSCGVGKKQRGCLNCNEIETEEIAPVLDFSAHKFGEWETVTEPSCIAGQKQRTCLNCNEIETEEIPALDDFFAHTFNEDTLCTTCGHQEFIESEEYIENNVDDPTTHLLNESETIIWWNTDKTYGLIIWPVGAYNQGGMPDEYGIYDYIGTPINLIIPARYNTKPITAIGMTYLSDGFSGCTTLKNVIMLENSIDYLEMFAFKGCTNLECVQFSKNLREIDFQTFSNCLSLKKIYIHKECTFSERIISSIDSINPLEVIYYG